MERIEREKRGAAVRLKSASLGSLTTHKTCTAEALARPAERASSALSEALPLPSRSVVALSPAPPSEGAPRACAPSVPGEVQRQMAGRGVWLCGDAHKGATAEAVIATIAAAGGEIRVVPEGASCLIVADGAAEAWQSSAVEDAGRAECSDGAAESEDAETHPFLPIPHCTVDTAPIDVGLLSDKIRNHLCSIEAFLRSESIGTDGGTYSNWDRLAFKVKGPGDGDFPAVFFGVCSGQKRQMAGRSGAKTKCAGTYVSSRLGQ